VSVRDILQELYTRKGALTPELLVAEAADPEHPLHARFEWDDSEAARLYRQVQAGRIIRSVKVEIVQRPDQAPVYVRAFLSRNDIGVTDEPDEVGTYEPVESVVADDIKRSAWFRRLEQDWKALRKRAQGCQEFADMVLSDLRDEVA
jgi:hypothetical protein